MILITGGAGYLGSRVVRKAVEMEIPVRCIVRPGYSKDPFSQLREEYPKAVIETLPVSFNDSKGLLEAVDGIDEVLHLAASTSLSASAQVSNTVVGSENLFQVCVEAKIKRFVLCSSFGVIGAAAIDRNGMIDENVSMDEHPEWRDPYSFAKHMQEEVAWDYYKQKGLPLVVIRPGVIFGPPYDILSARFGLTLFGMFLHLGGKNQIPLTYKDNCAEAIISAGLNPGVEGQTFCIVDDDLPISKDILSRYKKEIGAIKSITIPYSLLTVLAQFNKWYADKTHGHIPAVFSPYKISSMWKGHTYSNKKAKELLKWEPSISMKEALDKTFQHMKETKSGNTG